MIAAARSHIGSPSRLIFAVDGIVDRSGDTALAALVVVDFIEHFFLGIEIGGRFDELYLLNFLGIVGRRRFELELGERGRAVNRSAGTAQGQVRIGHQLEAKGGDVLDIGLDHHFDRMFGWSVALGQKGAVFHGQILLPAVRLRIDRGANDSPFRLVSFDLIFPGGHSLTPVGLPMLQIHFDLVNLPE